MNQSKEIDRPSCPVCDGNQLTTSSETERFDFGEGEKSVELTVEVNVHRCDGCGFSFTGEDASELRHEAACRHLSLMSPREIRAIRKQHKMSRAEFARVTRIGEASLARWENGVKFQNPAYDSLLYLVSIPGNIEALTSRDFAAEVVDTKPALREFGGDREMQKNAGSPKAKSGPVLLKFSPDESKYDSSTFELWPTGT